MAYDYIRKAYGKDFAPGQKVRHTEIDRLGVVARENIGRAHYVMVFFEGRRFVSPCHPDALEQFSPNGCPPGIPEEVWEIAYDEADVFSDLYGCDGWKRHRLTEAFARAILAERERCGHCEGGGHEHHWLAPRHA